MYTLATKKTVIRYILIILLLTTFVLIYEKCSHGVTSISMIASPVVVLGGLILILILNKFNVLNHLVHVVINSFIAVVANYLIIKGVLEIFGTTNELITIYESLICFYLGVLVGSITVSILNKVSGE